MQHVSLGKSNLQIGRIAYGCWRLAGSSVQGADAKIRTALEAGLNLIDTADIYGYGEPAGFGGAEQILGDVLAADPGLRQRMVLATKGGVRLPMPYDNSYEYLMQALEASLSRLKVETVDLYQIHRPDMTVPFEETARALNDMVRQGMVRHIGVSNFSASQIRALQAHLDMPLASLQVEISALQQSSFEDGTLDWCGEAGASALAWSPLAGGLLGRGEAEDERGQRVLKVLDRLAEDHGVSRMSVALSFLMGHQSGIVPIIGTQTPSRIQEAAMALDLKLSVRAFYDIVEAYRGAPMP